jgi:hypothetical protein
LIGEASDVDNVVLILEKCWEYAAAKAANGAMTFQEALLRIDTKAVRVLWDSVLQQVSIADTKPKIKEFSENLDWDESHEIPGKYGSIGILWSDGKRDTGVEDVVYPRHSATTFMLHMCSLLAASGSREQVEKAAAELEDAVRSINQTSEEHGFIAR